jgi:hypothetical protein
VLTRGIKPDIIFPEKMMKNIHRVIYSCLLTFFGCFVFFSGKLQAQGQLIIREGETRRCWDPDLGVRFFCDGAWRMEMDDNILFLVLSEDPAVTFAIAKIDKNIKYLSQLNRERLSDIGQYHDGFRAEYVDVAGHKALKVKAFARKYPGIRLLDYYVLHHNDLYGFMFSIEPKKAWDDYKFDLQKIVRSLSFTGKIVFPARYGHALKKP